MGKTLDLCTSSVYNLGTFCKIMSHFRNGVLIGFPTTTDTRAHPQRGSKGNKVAEIPAGKVPTPAISVTAYAAEQTNKGKSYNVIKTVCELFSRAL